MSILIEPIDLLKERLAEFEKAINKSTVANYNSVSTNLNPWIGKYKKAILRLERYYGTPIVIEPNIEDNRNDCIHYINDQVRERKSWGIKTTSYINHCCRSDPKGTHKCTGTDCGYFKTESEFANLNK